MLEENAPEPLNSFDSTKTAEDFINYFGEGPMRAFTHLWSEMPDEGSGSLRLDKETLRKLEDVYRTLCDMTEKQRKAVMEALNARFSEELNPKKRCPEKEKDPLEFGI